jgi:autotransporter translocation and assembly factor TamB
LGIGTDWNAFRLSPLTVTLNFPSIFLAKAPQLFHPQIFRDGILSGNVSLSETLEHPHIDGDIQLLNGKLSGDVVGLVNLTEASGRIAFGGNRASIEFLNVATKDTDLSLRGEIDFQATNNVTIKVYGAMPIFDLTHRQINCMSKIEFASAPFTLAPAVAELQVSGALFQPNWTVRLKERTPAQSSDVPDSDGLTREFPLCFSGTQPDSAALVLGMLPRPELHPTPTPRPRKRTTERH